MTKAKVVLVGPFAADDEAVKNLLAAIEDAELDIEIVATTGPDVRELTVPPVEALRELTVPFELHPIAYKEIPKPRKDRSEYRSKKDRRNHWR